jgi:hypothetical protein
VALCIHSWGVAALRSGVLAARLFPSHSPGKENMKKLALFGLLICVSLKGQEDGNFLGTGGGGYGYDDNAQKKYQQEQAVMVVITNVFMRHIQYLPALNFKFEPCRNCVTLRP